MMAGTGIPDIDHAAWSTSGAELLLTVPQARCSATALAAVVVNTTVSFEM